MSLQRARSVDEYIDWIKQARFEVADLRECLLYEEEHLSHFPPYLDPVSEGINKVYDAMCNGTYAYGREDLPFMEMVHRYADDIPFHTLLKQINETHRKGLDVPDPTE